MLSAIKFGQMTMIWSARVDTYWYAYKRDENKTNPRVYLSFLPLPPVFFLYHERVECKDIIYIYNPYIRWIVRIIEFSRSNEFSDMLFVFSPAYQTINLLPCKIIWHFEWSSRKSHPLWWYKPRVRICLAGSSSLVSCVRPLNL